MAKADDECTVVDTEEMTLQLESAPARITILSDVCTKLRNLFRSDKKATVDYLYMYMCDIVKDWNDCEDDVFAHKTEIAQLLLNKLRIRGIVDGITVCKTSCADDIMSPMMYPLFVGIRFYDQRLNKFCAAHIYKDFHQMCQVQLMDTVVSPFSTKITLNESDTMFKRKMHNHSILVTKKRKLTSCC